LFAGSCGALVTFGAAGFTGCAPRSPASVVGAGPLARGAGVSAYRVLRDELHALDVEVLGDHPARLESRGTASSVTERLFVSSPSVEKVALEVTVDRLELRAGGQRVIVAERDGERWQASGTLGADDQATLAMLMAVDVDLAAQGTALVLGGTVYPSCTFECLQAAACAPRWDLRSSSCARPVAMCVACTAPAS
jgi:hypothetical protein